MSETPLQLYAPNCHIKIHDLMGKLVWQESVRNKVTDVGKNIMRDLLMNIGPGLGFMALGTNGDSAQTTDTSLKTEVYRAAITRRQSFEAKPVFKLFVPTSDANGNTLREIGILRGTNYQYAPPTSGGDLFARATITPIVKTSSIQITFSWEFPISVATT